MVRRDLREVCSKSSNHINSSQGERSGGWVKNLHKVARGVEVVVAVAAAGGHSARWTPTLSLRSLPGWGVVLGSGLARAHRKCWPSNLYDGTKAPTTGHSYTHLAREVKYMEVEG